MSSGAYPAAGAKPSILVDIDEARGSTPRDRDAWMIVSADGIEGTIGGGQLEMMAITHARRMLSGERLEPSLDVPLGPEIGQCCGGRMVLSFRFIDVARAGEIAARQAKAEEQRMPVLLFGAGHVGLALAQALLPLPFAVTVIDSRKSEIDAVPQGVTALWRPLPEAMVDQAPAGSAIVILTHDHALDFMLASRALARGDFSYVGMIGSKTKKMTFRHHLEREAGDTEAETERAALAAFDRLVLPIGGSLVRDKRPAVIAALVAAELIAVMARRTGAADG